MEWLSASRALNMPLTMTWGLIEARSKTISRLTKPYIDGQNRDLNAVTFLKLIK